MINRDELILPVRYPKISSYPYHADLLAVVSNREDYQPWFFSNYIQLLMPVDLSRVGARLDYYQSLLWKSCPFIYYQRISRILIARKWQSIIDFIIDSIDSGYYVYFNVDTTFITNYRGFNKGHISHDIFVFGYNKKRLCFNVADNFDSGRYSFEETSFKEIEKGYLNIDETQLGDWLEGVELISYRKKDSYFEIHHEYAFDIVQVRGFLNDYLTGASTTEGHRVATEQWKHGKDFYGLKVYEQISNYICMFRRGEIYFDYRPFFVLREHKIIMQSRISYMIANGYLRGGDKISERCDEIAKLATVINGLWIKYGITKDDALIKKVEEKKAVIVVLEKALLEQMLEQI